VSEEEGTPELHPTRHGLTLVFTGDGKGKTTAALGLVLRAWGRGFRICVIQFVKARTGHWGEVIAAQKLGIEWHKTGDGFTWLSKDAEATIASSRAGWELAQQKILSADYDLVVLDEFTYPLAYHWLDTDEVVAWLRANKPAEKHVVITGRDAPAALVEYADLVTEMREIKHPYNQGIRAQLGIEF
jgi:cob(I)alamin adenosyltransferase